MGENLGDSATSLLQSQFFQEGPQLKNTFASDDLLRNFLRWRLPSEMLAEIEPGLVQFGERVAGDVLRLGEQAEAQPPVHVPFDAWGKRIDEIQVSEAWEKLHRVSAEEALIAIGYERAHGAYSRVHQFAKLYLFHPSSAFYTCPLAMTDGAARVLELNGSPELKAEAFKNLTSRNPQRFWTSGQWMTERTGGSDVSTTTTLARLENGTYRLYGDKWFTSATTSQMTLALAKIVDPDGKSDGKLSLFYLELRDKSGRLQNIRINRLKDKLGTKALPTAELSLVGTPAQLIGGAGEGVKRIASLLNITRLYNSTCALATMSRTLQLAKDYATKRQAFGKLLSEHPLHLQTLGDLRTDFEGMFHLVFHLVQLLGRDETKTATPEESAILRLLTPIAKLLTAKASIAHTSEVIESFGGAGYVEDTGLPKHLRDAQVYAIWEGTTNVLSLDVLRAMAKDNALEPLLEDIEARVGAVKSETFKNDVQAVRMAVAEIQAYAHAATKLQPGEVQAGARHFAFSLGRTFVASLMVEFAEWCESRKQRPSSTEVARRYCAKKLAPLRTMDELDLARLERLVYG